jgi:hypothetical protein
VETLQVSFEGTKLILIGKSDSNKEMKLVFGSKQGFPE